MVKAEDLYLINPGFDSRDVLIFAVTICLMDIVEDNLISCLKQRPTIYHDV